MEHFAAPPPPPSPPAGDMARGSAPRPLAARRFLLSMAKRLHRSRLPRRILCRVLVSTSLLLLALLLLLLLAVAFFVLHSRAPLLADEESQTYQNYVKDEALGESKEPWSEVLSWKPRVFLYHNFLSKEECQYLIELAKPHMHRSAVIDRSNGRATNSSYRTSSSCFLKRGQDKVVRSIEKRIADFAFIHVEHGEALQVVRYKTGERYASHSDFFSDPYSIRNGGQRAATFLIYLSDVEKGGETVFPHAKVNISSLPWRNELSDCAMRGLPIKPKMGDAILFWNLKPDGTIDLLSMHEGCPMIRGNKWATTKWMHVKTYKSRSFQHPSVSFPLP